MKLFSPVLLALIIAPLLSSCIAADSPVGGTGVSLNKQGQVQVRFVTCGERIEQADLYRLSTNPTAEDPRIGSWVNKGGKGDRVLAPDAFGESWQLEQAPGPLEQANTYSIDAYYSSIDNGATSAVFKLDDLERLKPGQVLTSTGVVRTEAEFEEWACDPNF